MNDSAPDPLQEWEAQLRGHGHRITPQREVILRAVRDLPHPTRESILTYAADRADGVNRSTVYRTLATLETVGLIVHTHIGPGSASYHLADDRSHVHLSCTGCARVLSVPAAMASPLVERVRAATGFEVDVTHASVYGLCPDCAAAQNGTCEQP